MSESAFRGKLRDELRKLGAWCIHYPAGPYGERGIPDLLGCHGSRFFAIECKLGRTKQGGHHEVSPLQARQLALIVQAGGSAHVLYPPSDGDIGALAARYLRLLHD